MRVLLDTTFLLPTLGIDTGREALRALMRLDERRAQICYSPLSLLECLWIVARLSKTAAVRQEGFEEGLRSIARSGRYEPIAEPPEAYAEALRLHRAGHRDMIDNLLYADSVHFNIRFLTLDEDLRNFVKSRRLKDTLISPSEL
jgi:predicted nucleic acid-binding protein